MKKKFLSILFSLWLAACSLDPGVPLAGIVNLQEQRPLPTLANQQLLPLRVAVAAVISPQGTAESYKGLLDYLSQRLGRPVELIQRRTYMEVNDLIAQGEVDLAFVCTSAYLAGHDDFGMELLAAPLVNHEMVYYSLLIVLADSPAKSISDLAGTVFAFTDPISLSGRMYPTYLLQQAGFTPDHFFKRTFFTYSHDEAIQAVANKVAAGAAVDSLVYEFALDRHPELATQIKVIHRSPPFGIPPVVVRPGIRPQQRSELQTLLLEMHRDPQGMLALQAIGVDQFMLIEDSAYDSVRSLLSDANPNR